MHFLFGLRVFKAGCSKAIQGEESVEGTTCRIIGLHDLAAKHGPKKGFALAARLKVDEDSIDAWVALGHIFNYVV